jgi:hypothetical protein
VCKHLVVAFLCLANAGCGLTPEQYSAISQNLTMIAGSPTAASAPNKLMVFGGPSHDTYLGCLSCSEYASDSIANEYGSFGSQYSSTSLTNTYSQFGSEYSTYSACNPYASDPPVIVDSDGNFYGRLTVNEFHSERTHNEALLKLLAAICKP